MISKSYLIALKSHDFFLLESVSLSVFRVAVNVFLIPDANKAFITPPHIWRFFCTVDNIRATVRKKEKSQHRNEIYSRTECPTFGGHWQNKNFQQKQYCALHTIAPCVCANKWFPHERTMCSWHKNDTISHAEKAYDSVRPLSSFRYVFDFGWKFRWLTMAGALCESHEFFICFNSVCFCVAHRTGIVHLVVFAANNTQIWFYRISPEFLCDFFSHSHSLV